MNRSAISSKLIFALAVSLALTGLAAPAKSDTIVEFNTAMGSFEVQLYDSVAVNTVDRFLEYVAANDYDNMFFSRLVPGFILQGGGFNFTETATPGEYAFNFTTNRGTIVNEFNIPNTRGTLAIAKQAGDPDSGSNQFFINLGDNTANLDNQNGGFTVFAHVVGDGMVDVVDVLASQTVWNATLIHPSFTDLPLIDYPGGEPIAREHLEMVNSIRVVFASDIAGDCTGEGQVSLADLTILATNYGMDMGASWKHGDFNLDQKVSLADLTMLASNYGTAGGGAPTPEPASLCLLAVGSLALMRRPRGNL